MKKIFVVLAAIILLTVMACSSSGGSDGGGGSTANVPGAPVIGVATSGNAQATVTFTPPVDDGGATITEYIVTSNPGAITATGTASPITVTGLTNGTSYTFKVAAVNKAGTGAKSAESNVVTPTGTDTGWTVSGTVTRIDQVGSTHWFTIFDGSGPSSVASIAMYSNSGVQQYKTPVLDYPGNVAGTNAMKGFADGTVAVILTVEDEGSPRIGGQAGTITFLLLNATGEVVKQKVVDRGWAGSTAWSEKDQCFYMIYSYKPGINPGYDVVGKVDLNGNLLDYETIPNNTFFQITANVSGIFLGGTVQTQLVAEGFSRLHVSGWSTRYPQTPSNDLNALGDRTFSVSGDALYVGGILNEMNGPQKPVILKLNATNGAIEKITYPGEEVANFVTDVSENLYGFKRSSKKLFRLNADGTTGWEVSVPFVTAMSIDGSTITVACNDGTIKFFDKESGNPL